MHSRFCNGKSNLLCHWSAVSFWICCPGNLGIDSKSLPMLHSTLSALLFSYVLFVALEGWPQHLNSSTFNTPTPCSFTITSVSLLFTHMDFILLLLTFILLERKPSSLHILFHLTLLSLRITMPFGTMGTFVWSVTLCHAYCTSNHSLADLGIVNYTLTWSCMEISFLQIVMICIFDLETVLCWTLFLTQLFIFINAWDRHLE